MSEIEELKARIAALEDAAKPKPKFVPPVMERFDPTAGMTMPAVALREMIDAPIGDARDQIRRRWGG